MAIFYIKSKSGEVFELTATTDVAFNYKSTNTRFPVEAGYSVTDHSVVENTNLQFGGVITDVVQLTKYSPTKGMKDYIEGLRELQVSRQPFTVYVDNRLKPVKNCLFTDLSFDRSQSEGLSGWRVRLSIEQIKIENAAGASTVKISGETSSTDSSAADGVKDSTGATKENGDKPANGYRFTTPQQLINWGAK